MARTYSMVYHPHDQMVSAAYGLLERALNGNMFSNGIVPINQVRTPIIDKLFQQYKGQVTYGPGKVPRRIRRQLLMRELRHAVEEAAIGLGLERRNVLVAELNGKPLEDIVKGTVLPNGEGGNVYWVSSDQYPINGLLTDHLGPGP